MTKDQKHQLLTLLGKIIALATNPHWTASRRYRIAELAELAKTVVEEAN